MKSNRWKISNHHHLTMGGIALLSLLFYSNSFSVPFTLDDRVAITRNKAIQIKDLSTGELMDAAFEQYGNRPVTNITLALNYYLGGLRVFGYHLFNLFIHIAAGMVLYLWIYRTLRLPFFHRRYTETSAYRIAAISAFLWIVHPVQTQAVTYVIQRATSLATLFYLSCLFTYVMGRTSSGQNQRVWFIATIGLAFLALGSKEIAITLPIVIILYDAFFICGLDRNKIRERLLFYFLLLAIPLLLGGIRFYYSGMKALTEYYHPQAFTMMERLLTEGRVLVHYLSLLIFPYPSRLTVDYFFPVSHSLLDPISTLISWILILFLITTAFLLIKRATLVSFCIFWFFINLALESTVIMLDMVFEHRLYLPSVGFMILLSLVLVAAIDRVKSGRMITRYFAVGAMVALLALWGIWTWERNWIWNDGVRLWSDNIRKYPENPRSHYILGGEYLRRDRFDLALKEFEQAISLYPKYRSKLLKQLNADALLLDKAVKKQAAETTLNFALRIDPDDALSHYNLGGILFEKGEVQSAIEHFRTAIQLDPTHGNTHHNLGIAYWKLSEFERASESFVKAASLDRKFLDQYQEMGDLLASKGLYQEALQMYKVVKQFDPMRTKVLTNMGFIYDFLGETDIAVQVLEEAIRLDPKFAEAYNNLGVSYGKAGYLDKAVDAFREAVRLSPQYGEALYNLARAYELLGARTLANEYYERARQGSSKLIPADTGKN